MLQYLIVGLLYIFICNVLQQLIVGLLYILYIPADNVCMMEDVLMNVFSLICAEERLSKGFPEDVPIIMYKLRKEVSLLCILQLNYYIPFLCTYNKLYLYHYICIIYTLYIPLYVLYIPLYVLYIPLYVLYIPLYVLYIPLYVLYIPLYVLYIPLYILYIPLYVCIYMYLVLQG